MEAVGLLPGQEDLGGGTGRHAESGAHGDGVAQTDRTFGGGDADAGVTLAAVQLGALGRVVAQRREYRAGRGEEAIFARRRRQLRESRS